MGKILEAKIKWQEEHPGQPLTGGLFEQMQTILNEADSATKEILITALETARQTVETVMRSRRQVPQLTPEQAKKREEQIALLRQRIAAAQQKAMADKAAAGGISATPPPGGPPMTAEAQALPKTKNGIFGNLLGGGEFFLFYQ